MADFSTNKYILNLPKKEMSRKELDERVSAAKDSKLSAGSTPSAKEAGTTTTDSKPMGTNIEAYVDRNLPKEMTESSKKTLIKAPSLSSAKGTGTRLNIPIQSGSGTKPSLRQSTIDPKRPNIKAKDLGEGGHSMKSLLAEGLTMLAGGLLGGNRVALQAGDYMNKFMSKEDALKSQRAMQQGKLDNEAAKVAEESYAAQLKAKGEQDKLNVDVYKTDIGLHESGLDRAADMVKSAQGIQSKENIASMQSRDAREIAGMKAQIEANKFNAAALNKKDKEDKKEGTVMVRSFDYKPVTMPDGSTKMVETGGLTLRPGLKAEQIEKIQKYEANQATADDNYNNIIALTKEYDMTDWTNTGKLKTALAFQKAALKDALELGAITAADAELIEPLIPDVSAFSQDRATALASLDEARSLFKSKYARKIAPLTVEGQNKIKQQSAKAQRFLELSRKMQED